jgi:NADH dehydrogenase
MTSNQKKTHVVILGGGFGGLYAAQALGNTDLQVTLIDKQNHHLFQPLLYQVATGGLSPGEIASPLRAILKSYPNILVLKAEATGIDASQNTLLLADGFIQYDTLIVATGVRHSYFGQQAWAPLAPV